MTYHPTPHLTDDDGRKLLDQLSALYTPTFWGENDKPLKMPRADSDYWKQRRAVTALQKAILDAADHFPDRASFRKWLGQNHREDIESYDPLRMVDDMIEAIRDLRWRMKLTEEFHQTVLTTLLAIYAKERPELPTPPPVGKGEFFCGEAEEAKKKSEAAS